jgi:hypothetical protein
MAVLSGARPSATTDGVVADPRTASSEPPTWASWREAAGVVCHRPHLRKTATIALVVGTVLFGINQLDVVLRGDATAVVWIKSAVTYVVPFVVSNLGVLVASRVDRSDAG